MASIDASCESESDHARQPSTLSDSDDDASADIDDADADAVHT